MQQTGSATVTKEFREFSEKPVSQQYRKNPMKVRELIMRDCTGVVWAWAVVILGLLGLTVAAAIQLG